jgi:pSer/pThr/pTyr-binding forkhead associated (FHA) protein
MARLIMRRGPTLGAIYELSEDIVTIGRGSKNTVIIRDNEVSREHCRLIRVVDDFELQDLESSNGTFVNGQPVQGNWLLQPGFLVELGDTITLEYERTEADRREGERDTQEAPTPDVEVFQRCTLMITQGPDPGRALTLNGSTVTIGRDLSNDFIIQDPEVSRFHVRLRLTNKGHMVEDLESTNGTMINEGAMVEPTLLHDHDVLKLGTGVQLQYDIHQDVQPPPESPTIQGRVILKADDTDRTRKRDSVIPTRKDQKRQTSTLGTGLKQGELTSHIFVAYAREEWEAVVAAMTINLQDAGLKVWVDQYLPEQGGDWRDAVEQALYECWMMVVVLSEQSLESTNMRAAYRYFLNRDKPLIPVVIEPRLSLPMELAKKRTLAYDIANPTRSTHKLVYEIKELRKQQP